MSDPTKNAPTKPTQPTPTPSGDPSSTPVSRRGVVVLGAGMLLLIAFLAYVLVNVWPCTTDPDCEATMVKLFRADLFTWYPSSETRLILLVLVAGALGSCVHAATSFVDYVGNNKLTWNWVPWYVLRPFIGMSLAALFYLVIRGGFFALSTQNTSSSKINPYAIAGIAGLVGMFSKQATDKLDEIFSTLFKTSEGKGDDKRDGKLTTDKKPTITALKPNPVTHGSTDLSLTVTGTNFVKDSSKVRIGDSDRTTVFNSATELVATMLPADIATAGDKSVTVQNPPTAGGASDPSILKVV